MDKKELLEIIEQVAKDGVKELDLSRRDITELPAEIGNLTRLTSLTLWKNQISSLPPELWKLTQLTSLNLSGNPLVTLPSKICNIKNLISLNLWNNQLTTLPEEIGELRQLKSLNLSSNKLAQFPQGLWKLNQLETLNLSNNNLAALPPEIGNLSHLSSLDLACNQITTLPLEIGELTQLTSLILGVGLPDWLITSEQRMTWGNLLKSLPQEISHLTRLTLLDLSFNQLTTIPPEIGYLIHLTSLDLRNNKIVALPEEIGKLKQLTSLDLSNNQLTTLPIEIYSLNQITSLMVGNNQIHNLPREITKLKKLHKLDLRNNPLPFPPEILQNTREPLTFFNLIKGQREPLNEVKLLFVGQGSVGKTSLVKRLFENQFDPEESITEGINIHRRKVRIGKEDIRINAWDFGGQEIMHATHQFFLTKRSLYVLVLDSRVDDQENRIEYWLKIIQSFGGESPIIIVSNKIDQNPLELDRRGLQYKYPNIKAFADTSCKDNRGIAELSKIIVREINKLDHVRDQILVPWFNIKSQLEEMKRDFIVYQNYEQLCEQEEINDEVSQRTLIRLLHDLGTILNFHDDPRLQDTSIINPEWVTGGVYKIINSKELFQNKGVLELSQLKAILDSKRYPINKHPFTIDIMKKFELCFEFEGERDKYLVPELLQKEEPNTGTWSDSLSFQYHYIVLPSSVISRFIVRTNKLIFKNTYWRNGVMLAYEGARALVKADREDRKILINITGDRRREFLAVIRSHFDHIHRTIPRLEAKEKIAYKGIAIDYQHLINQEDMGIHDFVPEGLREKVSVQLLLNGVESKEARRNRVMIERSGGVNIFADTVNIDGDVMGRDKKDS